MKAIALKHSSKSRGLQEANFPGLLKLFKEKEQITELEYLIDVKLRSVYEISFS